MQLTGTLETADGTMMPASLFSGRLRLTPSPISPFVILLVVITLLGYLKGLQVAILTLEGRDDGEWRESHPRAYQLHRLANRPMNVQRFLVGRQFYVIFVVMLISQVTTFPTVPRPQIIPEFIWTGYTGTALYGALVVLAFGQLVPQLVSAHHEVFFCNLPGVI